MTNSENKPTVAVTPAINQPAAPATESVQPAKDEAVKVATVEKK